MPTYEPIDVGVPVEASRSYLVDFQWATSGIVADFLMPFDEEHLLRVTFDGECIVRLLDEMALSTEDDQPPVGLVAEHLAYRVEGATFAATQSSTWKAAFGPIKHFRFITGWACLDVLTGVMPAFSVVACSNGR